MQNKSLDSHILKNGLVIYFYEDKKKHTTIFNIMTLFGGSTKDFITDGKQYHIKDGIAHVLEHYLVEENQVGNYIRLLGEKQMSCNASTSQSYTSYYFNAVENISFGINSIINAIYSPIFSEERLDKIKKPIIEELKMYQDNKFELLRHEVRKNLYHNIEFTSLGGTIKDLEDLTLETVELCYKTFYQPSNQIITVAGNFNKEEIINIIEDCFNKLNIEQREFETILIDEIPTCKNKKSIIKFPTAETFINISYKLNMRQFSTKEKLKLDFYLNYYLRMAFGSTSTLYSSLINTKVITYDISFSNSYFFDYNIVTISNYTSDGEAFIESIKAAIINQNSFDEELFDLYKRKSMLAIALRQDSLVSMVTPFIDNLITFNYPYLDTVEDIMEFNYNDFCSMIKSIDWNNFCITQLKNID